MSEDVWILGIHMTKFGKHPDKDTVDLASEAVLGALGDAGVTMKDIGVIGAGNLMGAAAGIGQQLQKQVGQTGIPVYNVTNACATGATALRVAIMAVKAGEVDMGLAVRRREALGRRPARRRRAEEGRTRTGPRPGRYGAVAADRRAHRHPDHAGRLRPDRHGVRPQVRRHQLRALRQDLREEPRALDAEPARRLPKRFTLDEIMGDIMIAYPNTRPMCSANCDGAAAAVVVSDAKLKTLSLEQQRRAVKVSASILTTDPWEEACQVLPNVNTLTRNAATQAYEQAGISPTDLDLVELHDCFATAELVHYDNLMLCEQGGAVDFFNSGATWRDGKTPVNVSGGLESKGHPIAATGIANIWEVCHHLRGEAGDRQIEGAKTGLAHVIGLGSACGVHVLEKSAL